MNNPIVILLQRSVLVQGEIWPNFDELPLLGEFSPEMGAEALADWCSSRAVKSVTILAETEGMEHNLVDNFPTCPDAKLRAIAPEVVADTLAIGQSELLGWSIEATWPSGNMRRSIVHMESSSYLRIVRDRLASDGVSVKAGLAWQTAATRIAGVIPLGTPVLALMLSKHGVAWAGVNPVMKRNTGFYHADSARHNLRGVLDDFGVSTAAWSAGSKPLVYHIALDKEGQELFQETIGTSTAISPKPISPDMLTSACKSLPSHMDLMADFPKSTQLDPIFWGLGSVCAIAAITFFGLTFFEGKEQKRIEAELTQRIMQREATRDLARSRQMRTQTLESSFSTGTLAVPRGKGVLISKIGQRMPSEATVTLFEFDAKNNFLIEGFSMVDGDQGATGIETFKAGLTQQGLFPFQGEAGGLFDRRTRRFVVRGEWKPTNPPIESMIAITEAAAKDHSAPSVK